MEGPGLVSELLDPENNKHLELHPGTINFNARLEEAQRIHKENMILASRLESMQPFYKQSDLMANLTRRNKPKKLKNKKKEWLEKSQYQDEDILYTNRSENINIGSTKRYNLQEPLSARKSQEKDSNSLKVLIEYTKIQNSRVLDIAVIKEPFQDKYAVFGLDVEIGQRYEIKLSSDDISNLLDGDILVTSLDNIEVWVVLLNKIILPKVDQFSKYASEVFKDKPSIEANDIIEMKPRAPESPPASKSSFRNNKSIKNTFIENLNQNEGTHYLQSLIHSFSNYLSLFNHRSYT